MEFGTHDLFIKLLMAMILGVFLGIERVYAHKTAGMRTYALIAMASALFVVIAQAVTDMYSYANVDPLRIAAEVVVGVGFLGAGIIIFRQKQVANLTTAAAIWIAAGIGMAVGFELYMEAIFATVLTLFVLEGLAFFERKIKKQLDGSSHFSDLE